MQKTRNTQRSKVVHKESVAQMVERRSPKPEAGGSNPSGLATYKERR